jgi:glycine oxidase
MDIYKSHPKHVEYNHFNYVILGAGLAGLTLSIELLENFQKVLLIDIKEPGAGASGTPAGLMNPATAQKARLPDDAIPCVNAFNRNIERLRENGINDVILQDSVLRPALDQNLKANFSSTLENAWPADWVEWVDSLPKKSPPVPNFKGGLMLHIAKAIDVPKFLDGLFLCGRKLNLNYSFNSNYTISKHGDEYSIMLDNEKISTDSIIDCTGAKLAENPDFRLHKVKGQIRSVFSPDHATMQSALSAYGYLAQKKDTLIVGSTYEHHFDEISADKSKDEILLNKIRVMTGKSFSVDDITKRWAGVRVTTPDRKPAIGAIPTNPNYYFYTGLGSKGLFLLILYLYKFSVITWSINKSIPI